MSMSLSSLLAPERDPQPTPIAPLPPTLLPPPTTTTTTTTPSPSSHPPHPTLQPPPLRSSGMDLLCRAAAVVAGPEWARRAAIAKRPAAKRPPRPRSKKKTNAAKAAARAHKRTLDKPLQDNSTDTDVSAELMHEAAAVQFDVRAVAAIVSDVKVDKTQTRAVSRRAWPR